MADAPIAAVANREGLDSQALLAAAAAEWSRAGLRVAGLLARNADTGEVCSADRLTDIGSGRHYGVRLDAAPAHTSCHLDPIGMEAACAGLLGQIAAADVIILSKFGKLETMQRGLWPAFAAAAAAGKPLLTSVSEKHVAAWSGFAPASLWLDADPAAIAGWWQALAPGHRAWSISPVQ